MHWAKPCHSETTHCRPKWALAMQLFNFFFLDILKILKENPSAALQERLLENPILLCGLACAGHATERPIHEGRAQN